MSSLANAQVLSSLNRKCGSLETATPSHAHFLPTYVAIVYASPFMLEKPFTCCGRKYVTSVLPISLPASVLQARTIAPVALPVLLHVTISVKNPASAYRDVLMVNTTERTVITLVYVVQVYFMTGLHRLL